MNPSALLPDLERGRSLIVAGKLDEASRIATALTWQYPEDPRPWHVMSLVHAKASRLPAAVECIRRALTLDPADPALRLQLGQYLIAMGRRREALGVADEVAQITLERGDWNDALGTLFTLCDEPLRAVGFFERAVAQVPNDDRYLYNLAAVQRMIGDLDAAEVTLNRVIAMRPSHAYAYYTRADLRAQTPDSNHIETMTRVLGSEVRHVGDRILMCFAIAKELDDVGNYDLSFHYLKIGSDQQRSLFSYRVGDDTATIDRVIKVFTPAAVAGRRGFDTKECLFVMGLPRTGTTLVEQILASHSAVHGAGELQAFPLEVIKSAQKLAGRRVGKMELAEWTLKADPELLGRAYLEATRPQTGRTPFFVDKQPTNYLYAGLIRRAFPQARMVVLARDPIDSCFAMYRTLFTGAYPFSYTLAELAVYYSAWHRLIRHWQSVLGDHLLIVRYEDLVLDFEATARRLVAHCGLEWEDRCRSFQTQSRAVTSASAVQVRRPIYQTSVAKWRNYREHLAPLVAALEELEPPGGWGFA